VIEYIKSIKPVEIVVITNGSHKRETWWSELGSVLDDSDTVHFSVDGWDNASNNLYRVNSDFDSIVQGIQAAREVNKDVFLIWATIIFSFNQDHLNRIVDLAQGLNMDSVQWTRSTKFGSKYGGYGGENDLLEPRAEFISKTHRYEREIVNLSGRRQNNHDYLLHNERKYIEIKEKYKDTPITPLCEIGNRGIYVNAEGVVFPCSWVSFPYHSLTAQDKTINWPDSFFALHRDRMNLNYRSFEEITADPLWNKCSTGFTDPDKTWVECLQKCSSQVVDKNYAVGWETN
jgi:MoaA/NifB/PqqE/SkfB family radical SAM enzyme